MKTITIVGKFDWEDEFTVLAHYHGIYRRGDLNLVCFKDSGGHETFIDLKTRLPFEMDAINSFSYSPYLERPAYEGGRLFNRFLLKSLKGCNPYAFPVVPREVLLELHTKARKLFEILHGGANATKKREFKQLAALLFPMEHLEGDQGLDRPYADCVDELYRKAFIEEEKLRDFLNYRYDSYFVARVL